jgi:hypothetical protein
MAVHFWSTRKARTQLSTNSLSQRDAAGYMFVSSLIYTYVVYATAWGGRYQHWTMLFEAVVVVVITGFGVHECYSANGGRAGRDFVHRFCVLGVPLSLRLLVLFRVIDVVLAYAFPRVVTPMTFRDPQFVYLSVHVLLGLAFTFIFYWRVAHHLQLLQKTESPSSGESEEGATAEAIPG